MGEGFLDSNGMIDSLVIDCNTLPKALFDGNCVLFCSTIVQMVQKLDALKRGIKDEIDGKEGIIEDLKRMNDELAGKLYGGNDENT